MGVINRPEYHAVDGAQLRVLVHDNDLIFYTAKELITDHVLKLLHYDVGVVFLPLAFRSRRLDSDKERNGFAVLHRIVHTATGGFTVSASSARLLVE